MKHNATGTHLTLYLRGDLAPRVSRLADAMNEEVRNSRRIKMHIGVNTIIQEAVDRFLAAEEPRYGLGLHAPQRRSLPTPPRVAP